MQPIDHAEFLDRIFILLSAAKTEPGCQDNGDQGAMAEGQSCRSFAEVYGVDEMLLTCIAKAARAKGDVGMADLLEALETAFSAGTLELSAPPKPAQRLLAYVYPVV